MEERVERMEGPQYEEKSREMLSSRQGMDGAYINLQPLWLAAQDLNKIKPDKFQHESRRDLPKPQF